MKFRDVAKVNDLFTEIREIYLICYFKILTAIMGNPNFLNVISDLIGSPELYIGISLSLQCTA